MSDLTFSCLPISLSNHLSSEIIVIIIIPATTGDKMLFSSSVFVLCLFGCNFVTL